MNNLSITELIVLYRLRRSFKIKINLYEAKLVTFYWRGMLKFVKQIIKKVIFKFKKMIYSTIIFC